MASSRTVNASYLNDFDREVISLCKSISDALAEKITSEKLKNHL